MHIRQLARNAALITVAAIVTAGFSTGIAQATSAAPTSTISVASAPVTPGGTAPEVVRPRMQGCPKYTFCAYEVAGSRELVLAQSFTCSEANHNAVAAIITLWINNCTAHAVYYYYGSNDGCVSSSSQHGRTPGIQPDYYYVAPWAKC
jgi:hypothetical protein